jgi:hypothetical protein
MQKKHRRGDMFLPTKYDFLIFLISGKALTTKNTKGTKRGNASSSENMFFRFLIISGIRVISGRAITTKNTKGTKRGSASGSEILFFGFY